MRAFRQALVLAGVAIALTLLLMWRNLLDAALVALPVGLAAAFAAASALSLGIHFNFANVIVIPLLLGVGVDTGIHVVHRFRYEKLSGGNLLHTSTARAVLALGISWNLVCNLLVLPVLVNRVRLDRPTAG